jgi:hypothetical protein
MKGIKQSKDENPLKPRDGNDSPTVVASSAVFLFTPVIAKIMMPIRMLPAAACSQPAAFRSPYVDRTYPQDFSLA